MKNVLIISSQKKQDKSFLNLFKDLSDNNSFVTWSDNDFFLDNFCEDKLNRKIYLGPPLFGKSFKIFILLLPFLYAWYLFDFIFKKSSYNIDTVVCLSSLEKLIFTPIVSIFKIKVIWFDEIELDYRKKAGIILFLLKVFSNFAENITFTEEREKVLNKIGFKNTENVSLGIELENSSHQDNIFSNLARTEKPTSFFKNFTIGTVVELNDRVQVEILLRAVKICSEFVSNLQLVIIGSGKEKKNFLWLSRKMEIEKQVWFVGDQDHLGKWFDNFDIYVTVNSSPSLFDLEVVLEAMSKNLPVIAFEVDSLKELVINKKTGILIKEKKSEELAKSIMEIEKNRRQIRLFGENSSKIVREYFLALI